VINALRDESMLLTALPAQTFTTLHSFDITDCGDPYTGLVQATDGDLYGTTAGGGGNNFCDPYSGCGTVFKITRDGALTTLYSFCPQLTNGWCPDGRGPVGPVQATNGDFYGAATSGGDSDGSGTIFKITSSGTLTTIYRFCIQSGCTDGAGPEAGLVQASNGDFYGTTQYGGANYGTVFKITPRGTLTTLYKFCSQSGCPDGQYPYAGLIQATNGEFYGTTAGGGASNCPTTYHEAPYCGTICSALLYGVRTTAQGCPFNACRVWTPPATRCCRSPRVQ